MAQCTAKSKRSGQRCKGQAVTGSDKCRMHGAGGGKARANANRKAELEVARQECERLGVQVEIDPGEALIRELWETAGNVAFYRAMVQQLKPHDGSMYAAIYGGKDGYDTGERRPHVFVELYNRERDHLTAVASAALRAGVEERRVRLAESEAQVIFDAQVRALQMIGMGDRLDEFRIAFGDALRAGQQPVALGAG